MSEAFVQLLCPVCGKDWQANLNELPEPGEEVTCDDCDAARPISEFTRTQRDFEVLANFYE